ncbi:MAG: type IX secretion system protein PorQ [Bacteroidales bacterium]|nr:type IX secretion system protein PorQ [Bacteroidales bacterium]
MKNLQIFIITLILIFFSFNNFSYSQIGGNNTYEFLNLPNSARIAGMGGDFLTIKDNDITLALSNPSIITPEMHNHLGFCFVDYYTDINYGFASYSRTFNKLGSFLATMQYIDYGKFDYADETGVRAGNFYVGESALNIGWGRQLDSSFSIGSNLKMIYSSLESYKSFGLAVDVAGSYNNTEHQLTISLIAKNIGRQLKTYNSGNNEPLPFEIQLGLSKRLKHLPFRYSILFNHIEKWDLTYEEADEIETDPITGEVIEDSKLADFGDKLLRHIVIGGEFFITRNFSLRAGYNYQRRQELKVNSKISTVGFSWGFGFRITKFHFSYARSTYHLVGSPNYITITTNFSDFFVKKNN